MPTDPEVRVNLTSDVLTAERSFAALGNMMDMDLDEKLDPVREMCSKCDLMIENQGGIWWTVDTSNAFCGMAAIGEHEPRVPGPHEKSEAIERWLAS